MRINPTCAQSHGRKSPLIDQAANLCQYLPRRPFPVTRLAIHARAEPFHFVEEISRDRIGEHDQRN